MDYLSEKYRQLGCEYAPGQEAAQEKEDLPEIGGQIKGTPVDFSHGDVDAHEPIPGSLAAFVKGYLEGGRQAYTEYKGKKSIRHDLAEKLAAFSGASIDPEQEMILTPGTQGALFLAMGALVSPGDQVALVEPDYFANRKLACFFGGQVLPIPIHWKKTNRYANLDLAALEAAFQKGAKVFLYSNPNNPTGVLYSPEEVCAIGRLAKKYHVAVIADELYARQIYEPEITPYTHLCALDEKPDTLITIMGPSKTESMSGFRLGVAYGSAEIISRMEKLQAIVSLRAAGYCQSLYLKWFSEPAGWLEKRIADHKEIRDELLSVIQSCPGCWARPTEGGSYLFWELPPLKVDLKQFVKLCRIQASVTVTPGTEFGPQFTHFIRLNFSQDRQAAVSAAWRICQMIDRYRA